MRKIKIIFLALGIFLLTACGFQNEAAKLSYIEDADSMAEYTREYLRNLDLCDATMFGDFLTSMQDFSIDYDNEMLAFYWTANVDHLHDVSWYRIGTFWEYSETDNNWVIRKTEDEDNWLGYDVEVEYQSREFKQLDFSGTWYGKGAYEDIVIEIYDFSWEQFSANIPLFGVEKEVFVRTANASGEISTIYNGPFYSDENGEYFCFYPQDTYTTIIYQDQDGHLWAVEIRDELPKLK